MIYLSGGWYCESIFFKMSCCFGVGSLAFRVAHLGFVLMMLLCGVDFLSFGWLLLATIQVYEWSALKTLVFRCGVYCYCESSESNE